MVSTIMILLLVISSFHESICACIYPFNATSSGAIWTSAEMGDLTVTESMITGYHIGGKIDLDFDFHCEEKVGDTYLLRAEQFQEIFQERTLFFLCLDIFQFSETVFYYYVRNTEDPFVSTVIFPYKDVVPNITEACQITVPKRSFVTLVRKDATANFNYSCPTDLFARFDNLTVLSSSNVPLANTGSCPGSAADVCTDRSILQISNNCSQPRTLSVSGTYNCLFTVREDGVTYLSLWNNDATTDETNNFKFSCFAYLRSGSDVYGTESPKQCGTNTNHTYTQTGLTLLYTSLSGIKPFPQKLRVACVKFQTPLHLIGASVSNDGQNCFLHANFIQLPTTCLDAAPTTTEGPPLDVSFLLYFLIIPAVILVIWLFLLIVVFLLICHRKYGHFFKNLRKHSKPKVHADKVWRSMLPKDKLSIIQSDQKQQFCFRPKRPIDLSVFDLTFETGSCPSIVPADKLSTLYPDPIEDYMRGKIPRYPSGLSLYSIDSVVFENRRSHIINWMSPPETESPTDDLTSMDNSTSESTDVTSEGAN